MKTEYNEIRNAYSIKVKRFEPESTSNGYILALHGFCGDMESSFIRQLGMRMTKHRIAVVAFNFPGHGSSDADVYFSLENCLKDMLDVMRNANNLYGVSAPQAIVGTSFGGYVTLLNLANIPFTTELLLRAPAVNMKRSFEKFVADMDSFKKQGWEEMGFERKIKVPYSFYTELEKNCILEHDFYRDMLIVHGDCDDVVLPEDMWNFCAHNPRVRLEVVGGADHRFKGKGQLEKVFEISEEYLLSEEE